MKILSEREKETNLYFLGIGGISMSALAEFSLLRGFKVYGEDIAPSEVTIRLTRLGAKISFGGKPDIEGKDAVIYTSAANSSHPVLLRAEELGIPAIKRSEYLSEIMSSFKRSVAVAGCHGKTTATAMIADVLIGAGRDPTVFLGGMSDSYGNFRLGGGDAVIAEACEYKRNFLDLDPKIAVVLNVDYDHADAYSGIEEIKEAFSRFTAGRIAAVNADDDNSLCTVNDTTVTFGIERAADYRAKEVKFNGRGYSFTAFFHSLRAGRINLSALGRHNVYNALAACAVCDLLGVPFGAIKRSLEEFSGVKRRSEFLGEKDGIKIFADYAHHPAEISAAVSAFAQTGERFAFVFQPHTYSRTRALLGGFTETLKSLYPLFILKEYPAREAFDPEGSAERLCEEVNKAGGRAVYADGKDALFSLLSGISERVDGVIFLGAGDVYQTAKDLVCEKKKIFCFN